MNMAELAERLKTLRKARGLTLQEVASEAGLTRGWLSKVENFRVTPSLPALSSIASTLGVTLSELFEGLDQRPPLVVVRKEDRRIVARDEDVSSCLTYEALAHSRPQRAMDPFVITVPPEDARPKLSHAGEEFLFVLDGAVTLEFEDVAHELVAGDSAYFDGEYAHRVGCVGNTPARVLVVFQEPVGSVESVAGDDR